MSDETLPGVHNKIKWARRYMDPKKLFASCLLAFLPQRNPFFGGSFAAVYYIGTLRLMRGL